jgi:hypothetical protein
LLFYIVHWCIDIEDRSLSGLYFNKIILNLILSYSILSFSNMTIAIGIILFLVSDFINRDLHYSILFPNCLNASIKFDLRIYFRFLLRVSSNFGLN